VPMKFGILRRMVSNLGWFRIQLFGRGGTRRPESIMLGKFITIEQVNFLHRCLRHQVQHVGTGAAQANDCYRLHGQLATHLTDFGPG